MAVRADPREDYRETILAGQDTGPVVPTRPTRRPAAPAGERDGARVHDPDARPSWSSWGWSPTRSSPRSTCRSRDKMVGAPGRFVGLAELRRAVPDEVFLRTVYNSVVYTVVAVAIKFVFGLTMALILDQERRFNNIFRDAPLRSLGGAAVVIVSLNWRWIFDDLSGFLNNFLITFHITNNIISWLSDPEPRHGLRHRGRRLGGHAVLHDDVPGGAPGDPQGALRGGRDRRGLDRPAVLLRDHPAAQARSS